MDACDNAIGFEHEKISMIASSHHSAVITRATDNAFSDQETWQKPAEQPVFA
jgi:hypothetical protein